MRSLAVVEGHRRGARGCVRGRRGAMAIGGLIRGYKRWNPVHPTYGAFWGLGFGLGCGVGWGPGFGPEVVGFVGSGCGVGFSMGLTLVGVGIGLPAAGVACVPCNVVTGAGQGVSRVTTLIVPVVCTFASQTWQSVGTQISLLDERLKSKNKRIRDGSFSNQIVPLSVETVPQKSSEEFHDFNRRSQVRFSTYSGAVYSPQQDVRSE